MNRSPTMRRPELGNRWCTSPCRPDDRVLHRDHAQLAGPRLHCLESVLEYRVGRGLIGRIVLTARLVAVGPRLALEGDLGSGGHGLCRLAKARAASRSAGVSTEIGVSSTTAAQIESPISRARSCSSFPRAPLQRRWRRSAEPDQRVAAIGIDADVLPHRPVAVEHRAGEVERPAARIAGRQADHRLDHRRIVAVVGRGFRRDGGGDVAVRLGRQHAQAGGDHPRRHERHVALQVDHDVAAAVRVQQLQRRQHPIGAGGQVGLGEHGAAAGRFHRGHDLGVARRHRDRADAGALGLAQHPHHHRNTTDVGQRLSRQPRGRHAGLEE